MKKKIFSSLFCLFLLLTIVGCSTANQNQTQSTPEPTAGSAAASDEDVFKNAVSTASNDSSITLTFVTNYGETIHTLNIVPGEIPDLSGIKAPDISGLSFTKWYLDQECTEPVTDGTVFARSATLYAGYRSNGSSFSFYMDAMPADTSFVLFSTQKITADNLSAFIEFADIYDGSVSLSIETLEENPSLSEEDAAAYADEKIDLNNVSGTYRYRLYAENGFMPGELYSIRTLLPEKALLLSVNDTSLVGNEATMITFKIASEKLDNRQENENVIHLNSSDCQKLTVKSEGAATAILSSSVSLKQGDVFYLPNQDGTGGTYYKVASVNGTEYQLEAPDSKEVWSNYELSIDSSDIISSDFQFADDVDTAAAAHQITSSIGYAAYVDAALDSVRSSPEVQDFLANVSEEDYHSVMNLRAVDFGFGPEELQNATLKEDKKDDTKDYGTLTINVLKDDKGAFNGLSVAYGNTLDFTLGTNQKTKLQGTVTIGFNISETCSFAAYGKMIAKNDAYASMTDDWTRSGIMPTSETKFTLNATLALGKDDDDEDKTDKWTTELGLDDSNSASTDITISIASKSYNLWTYVNKMKETMADNEDLYDMDLEYVDIYSKEIGKVNFTFTGVDSVQFVFTFKVGLAAQLNLQASISYKYMCDCYTTNGIPTYTKGVITDIVTLPEKDERCTGKQVLQSTLNVNVALQGGVGFRFGIEVGVNFSGFQMNSLLSVGITAEVGPYVELKGFFAYDFTKETIDTSDRGGGKETYSNSEFKGGAKVEFGIYLDVGATIKIIKTWELSIASYQWPIVDHVIGAWSSGSAVYGDFVDNEETVSMDGNKESSLNIATMGTDKVTVDAKTRSTQSETSYELETNIGDKTSSGLLILKGTLADGGVTAVQLSNPLIGYAYSYKVASVTRTEEDGRDLDGRIRYIKVTYTDPAEIWKCGHITVDGLLKVNPTCPDAVFKVVVKAEQDSAMEKVMNIFTDDNPTKTVTVNYTGRTSTGTVNKYHINFYDTDGNLLITDTYKEGESAVTFPAAGYTNHGTYSSTLQKETGKYHYMGDVTWDEIVGTYWGYNYYNSRAELVSSYDFSTARWTDTSMTSGQEGNAVTAASIGTLKKDVNVYLHMDYKAAANWVVFYVDPDNPNEWILAETVKTVNVTYKNRDELDAMTPTLEARTFEGTTRGAVESIHSWDTPTETYGYTDPQGNNVWIYGGTVTKKRTIMNIDHTYNSDGHVILSEIGIAKTVSRSMPDAQLTVKTATASIDSYTWGLVTFTYQGREIQVKTNVGEIPQVPAEYQNLLDISGWTLAYSLRDNANNGNENYSTIRWNLGPENLVIKPLTNDNINPTYYAAIRRGTNIYSRYIIATQQSDGSYKFIQEYADRQLTYDQIATYEASCDTSDFIMNKGTTPETVGDAYTFSGWIVPTQEDFEMGIVPQSYRSISEAMQASDGKYYLNGGQSYPIIALFTKRLNTTLIFDTDGIGTLTANRANYYSNITGNLAASLTDNNTVYKVAWTETKDGKGNNSVIDVPSFTSNGTVPDSLADPDFWSWRSTEKVNGQYLTKGNGTTFYLDIGSFPAGSTITFKPYIEKRFVTIQLDDVTTLRQMVGNIGDQITAESLFADLKSYTPIVNIYDFVAEIKNELPLPYTFGSADTAEKKVYSDKITVKVVHNKSSTLDLNGAALADGTTQDVKLSGRETAEIDLTKYVPTYNNGTGYSVSGSEKTTYQFAGWMNTAGQYVTKIHYGENVQAMFTASGHYIMNYVLDAGDGTFTAGKTKTFEMDLSKTLGSQIGYEAPTPPSGKQFMYWSFVNDTVHQFTASTSADSIWNTSGASGLHLVAVYGDNVVTASAVNQVYDGLTHSISAAASQAGSTLEYSLTGADGSWSTSEPVIKDVVSETVYVRASHPYLTTTVPIQVTVNITQAPATVTADNLDKVLNKTDPDLTASVSGMVNNEPESMISYTVSRAAGETEGTYTITPAGEASQGNYAVTYVTGTFTIRTQIKLTYILRQGTSADYPVTTQGMYIMNAGAVPTAATTAGTKEYTVSSGTAIGTSIPTLWLYYHDTSVSPLNITSLAGVKFGLVGSEGSETVYTAENLASVIINEDTVINIRFDTAHITFKATEEGKALSADGKVTSTDVYVIKGASLTSADIPDLYISGTKSDSPDYSVIDSTNVISDYANSITDLLHSSCTEDEVYAVRVYDSHRRRTN